LTHRPYNACIFTTITTAATYYFRSIYCVFENVIVDLGLVNVLEVVFLPLLPTAPRELIEVPLLGVNLAWAEDDDGVVPIVAEEEEEEGRDRFEDEARIVIRDGETVASFAALI